MANLKSRFDQWHQDVRQRQSQPAAAKTDATDKNRLLPKLFQPRQPANQPQTAVQQATPPGGGSQPAGQAWQAKFANLKPRTAASLVRNGGNAEGRGDLDGAMRWYRLALKIDPANVEAQAKLAAAEAAKAKLAPTAAPAKFQLFKQR